MTDLHCHILPGVDDGAASVDESLAMAAMAERNGVRAIAVTPHCNVPGEFDNYAGPELLRRLDALRSAVRQAGVHVELYAGMEVFATAQVPDLLDGGRLLTLGGSRYLLVEFAFDESPDFAGQILGDIAARGVVPVIAHPERYRFIQGEEERLLEWARRGYVLQINKGSLAGRFGRRAARTARWCMASGCVHLIASDAHSPYRRTTRMEEAWELAAAADGPEIADFLLRENPRRILEDRPVRPVLEEFERA